MKWISIPGVIVGLLLVSPIAGACGGSQHGSGHRGHMMGGHMGGHMGGGGHGNHGGHGSHDSHGDHDASHDAQAGTETSHEHGSSQAGHTEEATPEGVGSPTAFDGMPGVGTKALCPVMKNEFTVDKSTASSAYKGKTYVFCCPSCKSSFDADPQKYLQ